MHVDLIFAIIDCNVAQEHHGLWITALDRMKQVWVVKSDLVKSDGNPQDEIPLSFPVLHFGDNDKITILCDGVVPVQGDVTMGQNDNTNQLHMLEKVAVGCTELLPKVKLDNDTLDFLLCFFPDAN